MRASFVIGLSVLVVTACGGSTSEGLNGGGGASTGGASTGGASTGGASTGGGGGAAGIASGGTTSGGTGGTTSGGSGGTTSGGTGGTTSGGSGGTTSGGSGGTTSGGSGGTTSGGSGGTTTGGTGGTSFGGSGGTSFGGTGGGPTVSCSDLENAYKAALGYAKSCNPMLSVVQCDKSVPDELACPCPTIVNHNNQIAIQTLTNLKKQWDNAGCGKNVICPAIACISPSAGMCVGSGAGTQGTCKDVGSTN